METLLHAALSNALVITILAPMVSLLGRVSRRPALVHSLWLLVLLKLFTPPLWPVSLSGLVSFAGADVRSSSSLPEMEFSADPGSALSSFPEGSSNSVLEETVTATAPVAGAFGATSIIPETAASRLTLSKASAPGAKRPSLPLPWQSLLVILWLSGSACWLALVSYRLYRFQQLLGLTQRAPVELQTRARHLASRLGLARCPGVWVVPAPISPLLWALGGVPRLLVPASLLKCFSEAQWDTLLAHELAHLRRGDHCVRILELAALALYWWHPVVWWARRQLREAEEQCCDAWVVWALPGAAEVYAGALVEAVTYLSGARSVLPLAASGIGHMHILKRRLTMIVKEKTPRRLSAAGFLAMLGLAALLLPLHPTWALTGSPRDGSRRGC